MCSRAPAAWALGLCLVLVAPAQAERATQPHRAHIRRIHRAPAPPLELEARDQAPAAAEEEQPPPEPPTPSPPPPEPAVRPDPPPPEPPTQLVERRRLDVMGGGLGLLAVAYAADVSFTYGLGHASTNVLIPFVGPFLQLRETYGSARLTDPNSGNVAADVRALDNQLRQSASQRAAITAALIVDGVAQLAGLAMVIAGPLARSRRLERVRAALTVGAGEGGVGVRF